MAAKAVRGLGGALVALFVVSGDVSMADVGASDTEAQAPASETRNRIWVRQFGTRFEDRATGVAVDGAGNSLISGFTARFRPGISSEAFASVAKYDPNGDRLWTRQLGTDANIRADAVATDAQSNVLIVGETDSALSGPHRGGQADAFVAKYDASGSPLWVRQLGTPQADLGRGIATDALGNVVVAGLTVGSLDGVNLGSSDAFIAKYNAAGDLLWVRQFGTSKGDAAEAVALDDAGDIYIAGDTKDEWHAFIAKISSGGVLLWTHEVESDGLDRAHGVAVTADGEAFICGDVLVYLVDEPYLDISAFVAAYDATGARRWLRQLASPRHYYDTASDVAIDADGHIVIAGATTGSLHRRNPRSGHYDGLLAKYDRAGTLVWTRQFGSDLDDLASAVAVDADRNVVISGATYGALRGPNRGIWDAFVTKYRP